MKWWGNETRPGDEFLPLEDGARYPREWTDGMRILVAFAQRCGAPTTRDALAAVREVLRTRGDETVTIGSARSVLNELAERVEERA